MAVNPRALHIEPEDSAPPPPPRSLREQRDNLGGTKDAERPAAVEKTPEAALPIQDTSTELDAQPQHSFMRKGGSSASIGRPWVRAVLGVLCGALISALLLQVVVHERDRIVATEPSARPALEQLCGYLKCRIEPLRQVDAIAIDSSAFTKVRSDVYRLSFVLKNTAQTPVATPAVELTLTDMQDQAVVRRVFTTVDFGKQTTVLEPGAELAASVPLSVKQGAGHEKISGYRLLTFYP
mgnify:CR=1 FL=1